MSVTTKQYNNKTYSSTKLTRVEGSTKKNEVYVYQNLLEKRKKIKPKSEIHNLVRTTVLKKTFSKRDSTIWSYNLYESTEIPNETIPTYKIDQLSEKYSEALLKKTKLTLIENDSVIKN